MHVCLRASNVLLVSVSYSLHSYNEAIATIRRVPSLEHNFQLVINRVYEEGDQELLGDEDESATYYILFESLLTVLQLTRRRSSLSVRSSSFDLVQEKPQKRPPLFGVI